MSIKLNLKKNKYNYSKTFLIYAKEHYFIKYEQTQGSKQKNAVIFKIWKINHYKIIILTPKKYI